MSLADFIAESNRIEGILNVLPAEVEAHKKLLSLNTLTVEDIEEFVSIIEPGAELRRRRGLNVRVGSHVAPPGGQDIEDRLYLLLESINEAQLDAWKAHVAYETLHPFTDGNGRSGRAIWLWMMDQNAPLGFLHAFYYQTLRNLR